MNAADSKISTALTSIVFATMLAACTDRAKPAQDTVSTTPLQETSRVAATSRPRAETVTEVSQTTDADSAASTIRRYYEAVNEHRFADAYALWSGNGRASGKSLADFIAGFAETAHVKVEIGSPSRIEPAAGSRYITIPVTITATTKSGVIQSFKGTYDLRRSVVDGASAEQRAWRIQAADIRSG